MLRRAVSRFRIDWSPTIVAWCFAALSCVTFHVARAQALPDPDDLFSTPRVPSLPAATRPLLRETLRALDDAQGVVAYAERAQALAVAEPRRVALDPDGAAILRHEFIAHAPGDVALEAARAAGFEVVRRERYETLDVEIAVLRDARRRGPARALRALRAAMPDVETAFHHLYLPAASPPPDSRAPRAAAPARDAVASTTESLRIGLIDGGVDDTTPALSRARIERHGCEGVAHAQPHGTTVAGRLFDGRAGVLYAADLWCGERVGRGTLGIIEALDWMSRERVPVINISLVGPDNPLLRRAVARSIARGHVLVAAAGNDGPAAPALFPAAYPDVIGVAAVDGRMRVLPESASGPQVDFCAQGTVDARRRGTSFAAPVVARTAAGFGIASATGATAAVYARLKAASRDVGAPGRDPRCGEGFLSGR